MKKSILITGASTGMGLADTILFAQNGYQVFATYRNDKDKGKLSELKNVHPIKMDVTNRDDIQQAFQQISNIVGDNGLYAIVNNAADVLAKKLYKIVESKKPKHTYNLAMDAAFMDTIMTKIIPLSWRFALNKNIYKLNIKNPAKDLSQKTFIQVEDKNSFAVS